jgi:hypothetical protein
MRFGDFLQPVRLLLAELRQAAEQFPGLGFEKPYRGKSSFRVTVWHYPLLGSGSCGCSNKHRFRLNERASHGRVILADCATPLADRRRGAHPGCDTPGRFLIGWLCDTQLTY